MTTDKAELLLAAGTGVGAVMGALSRGWLSKKRLPAEIDSTIAHGAESAVQSLVQSLAAETARAERAEAAVRERDERIRALEEKLDVLQAALDAAREELHSLASFYRERSS